jgi:NAD(P)-dependent dehydrogenase (short-subunit alcohol dehydrogenase family)
MPDRRDAGLSLAQRLEAMGVEVLLLDNRAASAAVVESLRDWVAAGPVHGVYWLPALDHEGDLRALDLASWHEALRVRVKALYNAMRVLYDQIAPAGTFLVTATRLGGQHGYDENGAVAPLGGAVAGFTKTYKRERSDSLVKVVDFELERTGPQIVDALVDETLRDPGAVEIGYKHGLRWTVGLQERSADDRQPGLTLNQDTVFVVTGAAGSIVSAITADLAAASGGRFYLLDLAPEPNPANTDLDRLDSDKDGLKRDLFARIQARGERATPALVEKELAALERMLAARSAMDAIRASGGTAQYFSVDLADANAVAAVVGQILEHSGRIDVLLHAAGMERSHFLPDKDPREFDLVFDVKADGWFNLVSAIGDAPLGATVVFSSIAARFGNGGQADYASANDLLCKIASSFRTTRPSTRAIAIDWTAWGGIGMATRGSIPKMMELAGIDMLPPDAGIPVIRRELTAGGTRGEVLIAQRLGVLMTEWDSTGGLEPASKENAVAQGAMIGRVCGVSLHNGLTIETTLDPRTQPFLHDHQIDGTAVLPGVMGIEAFAEAAQWMLPEWHVEAVEDVNFIAPFKFYRNEPRTLTIQLVCYPQGDAVIAECQLNGHRQLPNQPAPQVTTHFTARVRLTPQPVVAATVPPPPAANGSVADAESIYRIYFHGPAYQVLERAWVDGERIVGELAQSLPADHHPSDQPLIAAPRGIELCFQTAGIWEIGVQGRMGLPQNVRAVRLYAVPDGVIDGRMYAVITPSPSDETFDADVVDSGGHRYMHVSGYRTIALPNSVDAEPFKALHAVTL